MALRHQLFQSLVDTNDTPLVGDLEQAALCRHVWPAPHELHKKETK